MFRPSEIRELAQSRHPGGGSPGYGYDEQTFRHLLDVEAHRAQRSGRPVLLLLVELAPDVEGASGMDAQDAIKLSGALAGALREVDIIGWYREDSIMGVILAQRSDTPLQPIERIITTRVVESLRKRLSPRVGDQVRLSLTHFSPGLESNV